MRLRLFLRKSVDDILSTLDYCNHGISFCRYLRFLRYWINITWITKPLKRFLEVWSQAMYCVSTVYIQVPGRRCELKILTAWVTKYCREFPRAMTSWGCPGSAFIKYGWWHLRSKQITIARETRNYRCCVLYVQTFTMKMFAARETEDNLL